MAKHRRPPAQSKKPAADMKMRVLSFRVTDEDYQRIRQWAELAGLTPGQFARARALGMPVQARGDLALINELRRQGGLLKHIAIETRQPWEKVEPAINDVRAAITAIRVSYDREADTKSIL
ncbi:plasmid mobilization protein [Candidatus Igneacidithiobacillus taiwanensis]|uniref:plasmid mobilization protein n=1 Tax=Candidatus Igneacidithiobacillus taiwanensis TaxID=1945924 RepID=UPI002898FAC5|nr:hypothetical protein [Candidatus Igneacidithiobacillus taiwanensis]